MNRRYGADPIRVHINGRGSPQAFHWRGRWYRVNSVLAFWVEACAWWEGKAFLPGGGQREFWRVETAPDGGVYELSLSPQGWGIERVMD
jgi:hypothetical protein